MCSRPNCGDGREQSRLCPRNEDVIKAFAELSISMCFIHEPPQLGTVPRMDSRDVVHTMGLLHRVQQCAVFESIGHVAVRF
jgi:hypothetical protein